MISRANQRRVDPEVKKQSLHLSLKRMGRVLMLTMLLGVTATSAIWLNQQWSVAHWDIQAEAPIKAAIEAELQAMTSRDFLSTRPHILSQQWLQNIPDLAAVRITRILPDALHIQADERVPAALWQDEQDRLHLFDVQGEAYRQLKKGESPDLPLLRMSAAQLLTAHQIIQTLARRNAHALANLSEIRAAGGHWQINFSRGAAWLLPQADEVAVIHHIETLLQQPRWRHRHWRVDARLSARWFIRPAGHGGVI